jgi:hypothetical protein
VKYLLLLCSLVVGLDAQVQNPTWRRALMGLPDQPPANTSATDIAQIESYLLQAPLYYPSVTPGDYEANREMVRRMTAYFASVEMMTHDPQTRRAIARARRSMYSLGYGMPFAPGVPGVPGAPGNPPTPPAPGSRPPDEPTFAMEAPPLTNVREADRETAEDLRSRYKLSATRAARAWKNAEVLRVDLASRGMALNATTAGSVSRLELDLELAGEGIQQHDWEKARSNLEAAEAETEKISKTVGR